MHFLVIFGYLQISFAVKSSGVDQVLTKIFQIDQKLTFNVFHILNRGRISKIEKNIGWCRPPPLKKKAFFGRLCHQIFFSILEIRPWFKIWKTLKVSFGSIWNILVNTWSTPIDLMRNEIWRFWKKCKKCTFSKIQNFQTLLIQNLEVFSTNNVFSGVLERVERCF